MVGLIDAIDAMTACASANFAERLMVCARDVQVERLKMIGVITSGDVTAYDQRKLVSAQIVLKMIDVHIRCIKRGALRRRDKLLQPCWTRAGNDFHRIKFPEQ